MDAEYSPVPSTDTHATSRKGYSLFSAILSYQYSQNRILLTQINSFAPDHQFVCRIVFISPEFAPKWACSILSSLAGLYFEISEYLDYTTWFGRRHPVGVRSISENKPSSTLESYSNTPCAKENQALMVFVQYHAISAESFPQKQLLSTENSTRQENISYFYRTSCDEVEVHLGYHIR